MAERLEMVFIIGKSCFSFTHIYVLMSLQLQFPSSNVHMAHVQQNLANHGPCWVAEALALRRCDSDVLCNIPTEESW